MTGSSAIPAQFRRTLMEAREASGRKHWEAAISLWESVVASNPMRADFWQALGDARFEHEDYLAAFAAYYEAFDLGAGFPFETAYRIAQCHTRNGQMGDALDWLERAFELGYRDLENARTDKVFESLHENERFRRLVGLIDGADLSRDEGWRYDLAFFSREIKRKAYSPWRRVSESEFDSAIERLHEDIPELSEYEILVEMRRVITMLGDGHANVGFPDDHELAPVTLPVQFYLFEEGLYIIAATPEYASLPGSEVLQFGGHAISQIIDVLAPIVPRDNDQWLKLKIPYVIRELPIVRALGLIPNPDSVTIMVRDAEGEEREVTLQAGNYLSTDALYYAFPHPAGWQFFPGTLDSPLPRYIRNQSAYYWFEHLDDADTIYFQFNRVLDSVTESLAEFTDRLFAFINDHGVRKLIIDLRCNNGGNTFLEMPFLHRLIGHEISHSGRLFVIIGRRTFSAAQNFATMLERHTAAIFVGEPTGSSPNFVGETIPVTLPCSELSLNVSDLYWQSSWPMDHRTWIAPTLYVPPTFAAYRENRDPALEAVLSWKEHLPGM